MFKINNIFQNLKIFNSLNNPKNIFFYSEGNHESVFFDEMINILIKKKLNIVLLTSNNESFLSKKYANKIHILDIGEGLLRTWIFLNINSKVFIMSLVDLNNFYLKKNSKTKTKFIYIFHSTNSMNSVYNEGALDHYDFIFCTGKHHVNEIREDEKLRKLKPKKLIKHGCPIFDKYQKKFFNYKIKQKQILIAPSWNKKTNELLKYMIPLIKSLIKENFKVILRPHPMTIKKNKKEIKKINNFFKNEKLFNFNSDLSVNKSVIESEILITDYSGIAWDFAFGLEKKVFFIDVERKIFNKNYIFFLNKPIEIYLRKKIGFLIKKNKILSISNFLKSKKLNFYFSKKKAVISKAKKYLYFNHKKSAEVASCEIMKIYNQ